MSKIDPTFEGLNPWTENAAESIDAAVFTGDEFTGDEQNKKASRQALRSYCERWLRALDEQDLTDNANMKDYTVFVFEDGRSFWCSSAGVNALHKTVHDSAIIRFEVKLDVADLIAKRDEVNATIAQGQTILDGKS